MSSASIWPSLHARGEDNGFWRACLGLTWSSWAQQSRCVVVISHCWTWMVHLCSWIHPRVLWDSYGTEWSACMMIFGEPVIDWRHLHGDNYTSSVFQANFSWSSLEVVSACIICDHVQVAQCRVYSWRSGIILTLRVLSWWLAHANVGVIACSRIIPSFLWPLGVLCRNSCQEAMEDLEMWDCTAVSSMVGSEARVLCYCATDDVFLQFTALLYGFKSLPLVPSSSEILICCCA